MANLLQLANQLKTEIESKNSGIVEYNKGLISKVQVMNNTAAEILEKIRNISGISRGLQQNIILQAAEIEDLKKKLEAAGKTQADKQAEIDKLQKSIAEAQAQGQGAEILKQQLAELQEQAKESNNKIQALTKDITDATQEIQKLLGSLNSPQAQQSNAELAELIVQLEKHISDINSNIPVQNSQSQSPINTPLNVLLGNLPQPPVQNPVRRRRTPPPPPPSKPASEAIPRGTGVPLTIGDQGWSAEVDRDTNRFFYYNKNTGEKRWDYPETPPKGGYTYKKNRPRSSSAKFSSYSKKNSFNKRSSKQGGKTKKRK